MIKEYKLPGLYVLGVPEKSLISFVTFSLSFLVLTVSYLLYFYFRGCPVELALLPPVNKLGEPVDIAFDAGDELSGKDVAQLKENIAIDAVKTDPGDKPSLTARLFGIFKKSKVPEEVIQEPEVKEEIQDFEDVAVGTEVPETTEELIGTEEETEEEKPSLTEKIVGLFKKADADEEEATETEVPETPEEEIETEEETEEEKPTLTEKIVGLFKKADAAEEEASETQVEGGETEIIEEPEELPIELEEAEEAVAELSDEDETEEENPSLTEKIVGFFQKADTEENVATETNVEEVEPEIIEESVELPTEVHENAQEEIPAENSIKAVVQNFLGTIEDTSEETGATDLGSDDSENEALAQEAEIEGSCEDLPEDKSLREKIWNFFGCGEKEVPGEEKEVAEEPESIQTEVAEAEETDADTEQEEIPADNSIKAVVQSFLGTKEEATDSEAVSEEDNSEDKVAETVEEIGDIENENDKEAEFEGSCEDLPEDKSLREKIWNFFGCGEKEEASAAEEETGSAEESDALLAEVEEVVEPADEIPSDNSIKAAVQSFLGTNKENTPDDIPEESTITDQVTENIEAIEEEGLTSDESDIAPEINVEVIEEKDEEEIQESVSDIPLEIFGEAVIEEEVAEDEEVASEEEVTEVVLEDTAPLDKPSFKERIINFFRRSKPEVIPVEEVVIVEETIPEIETKLEKESIKTRIGKFFNIFQSKPVVSDLETEIAETIVNGNLKDMIENSEKEPIVVDTIGLCPEVTRDNWLQLFMGRSFLCFVSFSLNLSVLIASYLLYF